MCALVPCGPRKRIAAVGPGAELAAEGQGKHESKASALMAYKHRRESAGYPADLERPSDLVGGANGG